MSERTRWLLTLHKSHRAWSLGFWSWLRLLGVFTSSSNFWIQFFHPIIFKGNLRKRSRWRIFFLVYDFSNFHHNSFRETISWVRVVKNDCDRSCLTELKPSLLSKLYVDPIHRVLMFLHFYCLYHARRSASNSILFGSLCSLFTGSTDVKNTACLLLQFCPVSILNLWWNANWSQRHQDPNHTSNYLCRNFRWWSRWHICLLVNDFFRLHHNYFPDTISWECVVEDDSVRSCLIELQSFPLSKLKIDPVHRILVPFPLLFVRCKTWFRQVKLLRIFVILMHGIHSREEYCLSVLARILSSRYLSWMCDGV